MGVKAPGKKMEHPIGCNSGMELVINPCFCLKLLTCGLLPIFLAFTPFEHHWAARNWLPEQFLMRLAALRTRSRTMTSKELFIWELRLMFVQTNLHVHLHFMLVWKGRQVHLWLAKAPFQWKVVVGNNFKVSLVMYLLWIPFFSQTIPRSHESFCPTSCSLESCSVLCSSMQSFSKFIDLESCFATKLCMFLIHSEWRVHGFNPGGSF